MTGSATDLVRAASVNVLQSYATQIAKGLADDLKKDGSDKATVASESARAALQAIVGCAGAAAGGSGDCGGGAMGASASVVLNALLNEAGAPQDEDKDGNGRIDPSERIILEDQQARTNLVATLVAAIASGAGLDPASANTAAQIETQNNELKKVDGPANGSFVVCTAGENNCDSAISFADWGKQPEGSEQRREYDEVRAQLPLHTPEEVMVNVLQAVFWGSVPVSDALVYAQRGYGWEEIAAVWNANKQLGANNVFNPLNTENWDAYAVQPGDTLTALFSQVDGVALSDLLAANPEIDPNALQLGQAIRMPTQRYVDDMAKAKLTYVRLAHFIEQNPDVPVPGVADLPAFDGEGDAVRDLNQPAQDLTYWYVNQSKDGGAPKSNTVQITAGAKGNWSKELNNPQPNTVYEVDNGSVYRTDNQGRVTKVEANLNLTTADRNTYRQCKAGKCGARGDEGGHLIASIFNGPGEALNLVPMDANLNKGVWKKMENEWAAALKEGKQVNVTIQPVYEGAGKKPESFVVRYSIDSAQPKSRNLKNRPGG